MSKHANPVLIGGFVLGAFALTVIVVLLLSGGQWFRDGQRQILYFEGAAQGLQVGAPVVLLGVKVGTVRRVQLGLEENSRKFMVPVTIEIEPSVVLTRSGEDIDLHDPETLHHLVELGLRGRLRMQSLLTGQLYVDLDFHPDKPARFFGIHPTLKEIPTIPTAVDAFAQILEQFPLETFLSDLATISMSVSELLAADETAELPRQLNRTLRRLEALAAQLDAQSTPLIDDLRAALAALDRTLTAVTEATNRIAGLADPQSPFYGNLSRAGDELSGAARSIRDLSRAGSPAVVQLNATLAEVSRAARALRLLAETLEQQPEALLRGKRDPEVNHAQ